LFFEFILINKAIDLQGAEEMAYAFADAAVRISWRSAKGGAKGPQLAPLKTQQRILTIDAS